MSLLPESRRRFALWLSLGATCALALYTIYAFIGTFIITIFLYYSIRPVYRLLTRHDILPRSLGAALAIAVTILPAVAVLVYTSVIAVHDLQNAAMTAPIPAAQELLSPYINISEIPTKSPEAFLSSLTSTEMFTVSTAVLDSIKVLGNVTIHAMVALTGTFFMLRDDTRFWDWAKRVGFASHPRTRTFIDSLDTDLHYVYYGNLLNAVLTGGIGSVIYIIFDIFAPVGLHIPYPTLLGALIAITSFVPVIGMKLVYIPITAYIGAQSIVYNIPGGLSYTILVGLVSVVFIDVIPDMFLRGYVAGRTMHVGLVIISFILGPVLFGWYGLFLGPGLIAVGINLLIHFTPTLLTKKYSYAPRHRDPVYYD